MSGPPYETPGPPYEIYWDPGFEQSLKRIGLTWQVFDRLGKFASDFVLQQNPFEPKATFDLIGTGHRYLQTRYRFPDLPAMLIAYEVDQMTRTVTIKGAEDVWDEDLYDPDAS